MSGKANPPGTWKTKYGLRRVRYDPPTLQEAIEAARGLTDDVQAQIEFAASLMGLPLDEVRAEVLKTAPARRDTSTIAFTSSRSGGPRAVVVERKPTRRVLPRRAIA